MRVLSAMLVTLLLATSPVGAEPIDGVAAIVGKQVILKSEVAISARLMLGPIEQQRGPLPPELIAQAHEEALEGLIGKMLVSSFAERRQLAASPEEIDTAIGNIAADENVDVATIYATAKAQGLGRDAYRHELGSQITRMKVMSGSVRGRVDVSEEEVQALFAERYQLLEPGPRVRVRHILVPWPDDATPAKKQRIREIAAQIRERAIETGAFADLARQFSRAPSAADGGLSTFREGDVDPVIAIHVFGLPAGEITPIIETEHGTNVFQIVNRFDPADIEYDDVSAELRAELVERRIGPEFDKWVKELREGQYVKIVGRP